MTCLIKKAYASFGKEEDLIDHRDHSKFSTGTGNNEYFNWSTEIYISELINLFKDVIEINNNHIELLSILKKSINILDEILYLYNNSNYLLIEILIDYH